MCCFFRAVMISLQLEAVLKRNPTREQAIDFPKNNVPRSGVGFPNSVLRLLTGSDCKHMPGRCSLNRIE